MGGAELVLTGHATRAVFRKALVGAAPLERARSESDLPCGSQVLRAVRALRCIRADPLRSAGSFRW